MVAGRGRPVVVEAEALVTVFFFLSTKRIDEEPHEVVHSIRELLYPADGAYNKHCRACDTITPYRTNITYRRCDSHHPSSFCQYDVDQSR